MRAAVIEMALRIWCAMQGRWFRRAGTLRKLVTRLHEARNNAVGA